MLNIWIMLNYCIMIWKWDFFTPHPSQFSCWMSLAQTLGASSLMYRSSEAFSLIYIGFAAKIEKLLTDLPTEVRPRTSFYMFWCFDLIIWKFFEEIWPWLPWKVWSWGRQGTQREGRPFQRNWQWGYNPWKLLWKNFMWGYNPWKLLGKMVWGYNPWILLWGTLTWASCHEVIIPENYNNAVWDGCCSLSYKWMDGLDGFEISGWA